MQSEVPVSLRSGNMAPLRNEPVQARSTARLIALLDAGAAIVDEIGSEQLTTALVAERAGASIGTVYRYFPDRVALLQALGARNLDLVIDRVGAAVLDPAHKTWGDALVGAFDVLVGAMRSEPGFRGLRVGDTLDIRPVPTARPYKSLVSDRMLDGLVQRFGYEDTPKLRLVFETVVEVAEAIATRAFAHNSHGDEEFLRIGLEVVYLMLVPHLGESIDPDAETA